MIDLDSTEIKRLAGVPEFTHQGGDPRRHAILAANQRCREGQDEAVNIGPAGGFGRVALRIPEFDYPFIKAMFPGIGSPDGTERTRAWQKFAKSPLSEPYRTDRKVRKGGI